MPNIRVVTIASQSGYSGFSATGLGSSGYSGYSGGSGYSGYSSYSGYSGFSGSGGGTGTSGYSGFSSSVSGISGFSGSGVSGYSGFSGTGGTGGTSGYSGYSGGGGATGSTTQFSYNNAGTQAGSSLLTQDSSSIVSFNGGSSAAWLKLNANSQGVWLTCEGAGKLGAHSSNSFGSTNTGSFFGIFRGIGVGAQSGTASEGLLYYQEAGSDRWRFSENGGAVKNLITQRMTTLSANFTNATATMANLTDLSVTIGDSVNYAFELTLFLVDSVAADGWKIDFDGGTANGNNNFRAQGVDSSGTWTAQSTAIATDLTSALFTGDGTLIVKGTINSNAGGTFIPRAAQNAHTSGTLTVYKGSNLVIWEVQ